MAIVRRNALLWIVANALGELTLTVPAGALGNPTPVKIGLDADARPLTPDDTRLCAWMWTKAGRLDKESKQFLKDKWIRANRDQFSVYVAHGKGEARVMIANVYTLGSMVARPGASSEIDFHVPMPETAAEQAEVKLTERTITAPAAVA